MLQVHEKDIYKRFLLTNILGFSMFSLLVLGAVGEFFRKFVGIIYLKQDRSEVIISHNTFWGTRKDVVMDTSDIMPVADTPEDVKKELIWKIYLYSNKNRNFYICTKFGGILSYPKFTDIFGGDDFEIKK